jgi:CubicO group peptidase (beta-lactamase class C family)
MAAHGSFDPRFAGVAEELERNFAERGEVGAAVCVTVDGETVVDLWDGVAEPASGRAWAEDTIGLVWSCTKGATALCAHVLASRGELDLDAPVARYWPEFAKNSKDDLPVRFLLNHQAGLPALRDPLRDGAFYDWELVVDRLAAEQPFWEPGTRHGYHALTFGFLVGEVVRRVSGRPLGRFFREEVAEPLGLDFWIGLPEEHEPRVAPTIPADPPDPDLLPSMYQVAFSDPASIPALILANSGGYMLPGEADTRTAHAADLPATGGITNARGLAGMYRPLALGGAVDGMRLVDESQLLRMSAVSSSTSVDASLMVPTRWSLGFVKGSDNRRLAPGDRSSVLVSESAFGHTGMGGSFGFADPAARMSFGYSMNKQGPEVGLTARAEALVGAVYRSLGFRLAPGGWYE